MVRTLAMTSFLYIVPRSPTTESCFQCLRQREREGLSENFGLVVAEALERGKRVITTDGAPAWESECKMENVKCKVGDGEIWIGYYGRLIYLKGYRDGTDTLRVSLLKDAIEKNCMEGDMSIALLILVGIMTLIVVVVVGIEIVDCVIARKDRKQLEKMTPEEQRKYQEAMHKAQAWSNSSSI